MFFFNLEIEDLEDSVTFKSIIYYKQNLQASINLKSYELHSE